MLTDNSKCCLNYNSSLKILSIYNGVATLMLIHHIKDLGKWLYNFITVDFGLATHQFKHLIKPLIVPAYEQVLHSE